MQNEQAYVFQRNSKFRLLCLVTFDTVLQGINRKRERMRLLHTGLFYTCCTANFLMMGLEELLSDWSASH